MNIKRAIGFGAILWILIFVIISIIMFIPPLEGKELAQSIIYWIVLIPVVLIAAKWYFKVEPPTWNKGLLLGVIAIIVGTILDLVVTIPLFIAQDTSYAEGLKAFYLNWKLYVGFIELIILTILAGGEFDKTFTKSSSK